MTTQASSWLGDRSAPAPAATDRKERILVIDDEQNIRATLAEFIELSGYEVDTAPDGTSGLDLLGRRSYDLVLSDLKMPGVDGIAVIERMREIRPGTPVVVMTGFATVESTIRALRLGAQDYLLKPFTLDEIERTIGHCLEKRRLERRNTELTLMNQRLREIERIKDDLLATVSHEFRTPLTAMKGFLMLMHQQGTENLRPDQGHAIEVIRDNVNRLDTMIGNLLTLVDSEDGSYHPILEPVRMGSFVEEFLRNADGLRAREDFRLEMNDDAGETEVLLDRVRFPLVLSNLLDNAFKFAREPGTTRVVLEVRRDPEHVFLEVHDDGIGIPESQGDRVFDRFTQADMTSTREYPGTGLGLAVVREIVNAHRGQVHLAPPVLGGTSVRVVLPALKPREA